jgi:hypothetical protein
MMKRFRLSEFEARAQRLVEGSFNRLLGGQLGTLDVANRLAKVAEDEWSNGRSPYQFTIHLHPDDAARILVEQPDIETMLADYVMQLAQQAEQRLLTQPTIRLLAAETVAPRQVRIEAVEGEETEPTTQIQAIRPNVAEMTEEVLEAIRELDAYLIVDGGRHVALDRPVVNLGRRMDNEVVLDAPTVSRRHAQIRWRYGRFILYDLSNRPGRTAVNGQPAQEYALQSGDVISLSDVRLIYGEGQLEPNGHKRPDHAFDEEETMLRPDQSSMVNR